MRRGIVTLTIEEAIQVSQMVKADKNAPTLLQQKFANQAVSSTSYELSAEDVEWLLDHLPIPPAATSMQKAIRQKLSAFLARS